MKVVIHVITVREVELPDDSFEMEENKLCLTDEACAKYLEGSALLEGNESFVASISDMNYNTIAEY